MEVQYAVHANLSNSFLILFFTNVPGLIQQSALRLRSHLRQGFPLREAASAGQVGGQAGQAICNLQSAISTSNIRNHYKKQENIKTRGIYHGGHGGTERDPSP